MKRGRFWIAQTAFACMVVWSGWLLYQQAASIEEAFNINGVWLVSAIGIKAGTILVSATKFRELSRLAGLRLPPREWFGLSIIPTFHAYLSPAQTGHILRAFYLRNRYAFQYRHYGAVVAAAALLETTVAALIGLALAMRLINGSGSLAAVFTSALAILCTLPLVLIAASRLRTVHDGWISRFAAWASGCIQVVTSMPLSCLRLTLLCTASVLARWAGLYASFRVCGIEVDPMLVLVIESARTIAGIVNITPSNIGIAEGVIVGSAAILGIPATQSLPAAVVSRLISMVLYIVPGIWFTKSLLANMPKRSH